MDHSSQKILKHLKNRCVSDQPDSDITTGSSCTKISSPLQNRFVRIKWDGKNGSPGRKPTVWNLYYQYLSLEWNDFNTLIWVLFIHYVAIVFFYFFYPIWRVKSLILERWNQIPKVTKMFFCNMMISTGNQILYILPCLWVFHFTYRLIYQITINNACATEV